jgi:type 1 glutamine amidotransferase
MIHSSKFFLAAILCALGLALPTQAAPKNVLVVTVTKGFRHDSIPTAEKVLGELAEKSGAFTVDYVRNDQEMAEKMTPQALEHYDAVVFANTTGALPLPDKQAFIDWIKSGKGFVGMHAAADTFDQQSRWDPYVEMLGAEFQTHHAQVEVEALNQDEACPICRHLGPSWKVYDEIYLMNDYDPRKVHELLTLDKHPNDKTPGHYPISWCKMCGQGRVFYTSLGHRKDVWDPNDTDRKNSKEVAEAYQKLILNGIKWAVGLEDFDARPQPARPTNVRVVPGP